MSKNFKSKFPENAIPALSSQILEIREGKTGGLERAYGHAIGAIANSGFQETLRGQTEDQIITAMKNKAKEEIKRWGSNFLEFMRPDLKELIIDDPEIQALLKK